MRSSIIGRQFYVKCNEQRDHVRFGRRIEYSKTPDTTFIWAEFWDCDHCGNHLEKREERPVAHTPGHDNKALAEGGH